MPSKKKQHSTSKIKVVLSFAGAVLAVLALVFIGKAILSDVERQQRIKNQYTTLEQTLADITPLYANVAAMSYDKKIVQSPENACSEISSKSWNKSYTCGTQAQIIFINADDAIFESLNQAFQNDLTNNTSFSKKTFYEANILNYDNSIDKNVSFVHAKTKNDCSALFTLKKNENIVKFYIGCSLNTNTALFTVKD